MSGAPWTIWIWWLGGGLLLAVSLALLAWALFWDRSRGRKRCPRCWYDMSGAPASAEGAYTCSECGKAVKREQKLYATRRRKRWALLALVGIIASGYVAVQPRVKERGWWSLVSTKMLIAGLPLAHDADDFWCSELARRIERSLGGGSDRWMPADGKVRPMLTQDEWAVFLDRCVKGDWLARPVSHTWQDKYGELLDIWIAAPWRPRPSELLAEEHRLYALPVTVSLRTREPWPTDVQPCVECRMACWWPRDKARSAVVTPRDDAIAVFGVSIFQPHALLLPDFQQQEREFVFDVVIEERTSYKPSDLPSELARDTVSIVVRREGTIDEHITPLEGKKAVQTTALMQAGSRYEVIGGGSRGIALDTPIYKSAQFEGVAFGYHVEVLLDGEVVYSTPYWQLGGVVHNFTSGAPVGDRERLKSASVDENWQVRFRSDQELALRVLDADRCWVGEFTIPLTITD